MNTYKTTNRQERRMNSARVRITSVAAAVYIAAIVLANYLIVHGFPGATATGFGTYTIPVGFGLLAPAGTFMAAVAFPARDVLQRSGGRLIGLAAILVGGTISWWVSNPTIALASMTAFLCSEFTDFAIFTPTQNRIGLPKAMLAAGVPAAALDSWVFLYMAGLWSASSFWGLMVGKAWVLLVAFPIMYALRRLPSLQVAAT